MGFELGKGFLDSVISARQGAFAHLEDFADRLSHFFSCGIMLMLAGVTMANVYFLRPIACTLPTAPENKFNEFAESVCWVSGTIALSEVDEMPNDSADWKRLREKADISFYQWVPFCMSVQAMLFVLPHLIWRTLAHHTMGENLEAVLDLARKANIAEESKKRRQYIETAAYNLCRLSCHHQDNRENRWAKVQRRVSRLPGGLLFVFSKRLGNYVTLAYLFVKSLYLVNAIGQLYIIRTFLGYRGSIWKFGDALIGTLFSKREWSESEFFPRQTYCPVDVRQLGTKHNVFTAICALPVNIFNEKIYIFLWLWIAMVSVVTALSLLIWIIRIGVHSFQAMYIRNYLLSTIRAQLTDPFNDHSDECEACNVDLDDLRIDDFIFRFVRNDGAFLVRMIRGNAGDVVTGEILNEWWHLYIKFDKMVKSRCRPKYINNYKNEPEYPHEHMSLVSPSAPVIGKDNNFV